MADFALTVFSHHPSEPDYSKLKTPAPAGRYRPRVGFGLIVLCLGSVAISNVVRAEDTGSGQLPVATQAQSDQGVETMLLEIERQITSGHTMSPESDNALVTWHNLLEVVSPASPATEKALTDFAAKSRHRAAEEQAAGRPVVASDLMVFADQATELLQLHATTRDPSSTAGPPLPSTSTTVPERAAASAAAPAPLKEADPAPAPPSVATAPSGSSSATTLPPAPSSATMAAPVPLSPPLSSPDTPTPTTISPSVEVAADPDGSPQKSSTNFAARDPISPATPASSAQLPGPHQLSAGNSVDTDGSVASTAPGNSVPTAAAATDQTGVASEGLDNSRSIGKTRTVQEQAASAAFASRGDAMLAIKDIVAARGFYEYAAKAGSARAAMSLAQTYDPAFLNQLGAVGTKPNPDIAAVWYRRAAALGNRGAEARLQTLTANAEK